VQIGFVTTTRPGRSSCRTASSRCGTRTATWWRRRNSPARPASSWSRSRRWSAS